MDIKTKNTHLQQQVINIKISGLLIIFSAVICFVFLGFAIGEAPWFSWTDNWISELSGSVGQNPIWSARGASSVLFNVGVVLAGICGIIFSIYLRKTKIFFTKIGRAGLVLLMVDMCALCAIGIFPATLGKPHVYSSYVLFGFIPLFLLFISFEIKRLFGSIWYWTIILTSFIVIFVFGSFLFLQNFSEYSKAISETVMLSILFIFCITLSLKLLYKCKLNQMVCQLNQLV